MSATFDFNTFNTIVPKFGGNTDELGRFIYCYEIVNKDLEKNEKKELLKHIVGKFTSEKKHNLIFRVHMH